MYMKRDKTKNSIVDDLEDAEKVGGVGKSKVDGQLFCCKASVMLDPEPEPLQDFSTVKFPKIKRKFT